MCDVGDFYVGLPVRIGHEECIHIIGGVDGSGGVYTAPDPFLVDLKLVEEGLVPSTFKDTHLSVAFCLNPVRVCYALSYRLLSDIISAYWLDTSQTLSEGFVDGRACEGTFALPPQAC